MGGGVMPKKKKYEFSEGDLEVIREQRLAHHHPRIRQKLDVLWLESKGLAHAETCRLTELGRRTVQRYLEQLLNGGLASVLEVPFARPRSDLDDHTDLLKEHFAQHPPRRAREAQQQIERLTGL